MSRGRQAEKLGATVFERINQNGLATEKAPNQLLMDPIPDKRLGAPSSLSCGRGFPLPSVLVDPFNSVARRFSGRENVGSPVRPRSVSSWSLLPTSFTRWRAEFSMAREDQNDMRFR
jgi:hypothetical protein